MLNIIKKFIDLKFGNWWFKIGGHGLCNLEFFLWYSNTNGDSFVLRPRLWT